MNNKVYWLDNIRAIACIMVVVLHTAAIYILKSEGFYWEFANIVDSFTRVCVPLFFMISGYLFFYDKQVQPKNFIRLIIPLLFYSAVGLIFSYLSFRFGFIANYHFNLISSPAFYHLWYFYPLILIYAISYYIKVRDFNISKNSVLFFIIIFFVLCNPAINILNEIIFGSKYENYFFIESEFFYFLGYALIGALLRDIKFSFKEGWFCLFLYIIFSLIIAFFVSYTKNIVFYNFTGPLVCFSAISFFIFFKSRDGLIKKNNKFLNFISSYSLGVYGIHAFVLLIVEKIFNIRFINPVVAILVFSIVVLGISLSLSFILRKFDKNGYIV